MNAADDDDRKRKQDHAHARGNAWIAAGAPIGAALVTLVGTLATVYFSPQKIAGLVAPNAAATTTVTRTTIRTVTTSPSVTTGQTTGQTTGPADEPTSSPTPTGNSSVYLVDVMDSRTDSHGSSGPGAFKINGNTFLKSIGVEVWSPNYTAWSEYTLDGSYRTFSATLGVNDVLPTDSAIEFVVTGNGKELYKKTVKYTQQTRMSVDITGMVKLRLAATRVAGGSDGYSRGAVFGDAVLSNERTPS